MCFTIIQNEKTPVQALTTRSSKSRKIESFPKGLVHGLVQNLLFFHVFIQGNIGQENVFYDILEGKNAFLSFEKSKNCDFFEGVRPWFWSQIHHFSIFLFQAIQAMKMCFTIFQNEKTLLQALRTRVSKSRKIESFPKGLVHGFDPKLAIFPSFHFSHQRAGKCVLRYSRRKKRLSRL